MAIGKQLLITRGALTTFSIANDVAKYFAIIPAMFVGVFPGLDALNVMRLSSPESAILSAVIFNALIIVALIPLALRGVKYRPVGGRRMLRRNLLVYGLGGIVAPFIGIKLIDLVVSLLPGIGVMHHGHSLASSLAGARARCSSSPSLLGVALPAGVTGVGQVVARDQADGSLVDGRRRRSSARR